MELPSVVLLAALPAAMAAGGPIGSSAGPAAGPAAPPAAEQGATFETGGGTIWYEVRGGSPAPPLVVVNGGPGFDHAYLHCSDAWDRAVFERSGHLPFCEESDAFVSRVEAFLAAR